MSSRRRVGYNWKARQRKPKSEKIKRRGFCVELDEALFDSSSCSLDRNEEDSNVQILPPKKVKLAEDAAGTLERKKLNAKQRKRLLKVIEAKEKKAQVTPINAHHTWLWLF